MEDSIKISAFVTISNPDKRQDPYVECIENMLDFADEVVVVNGTRKTQSLQWGDLSVVRADEIYPTDKIKTINYEWPEDFDWKFIGQQFQRGYEACTGDWVFRFDADYFIHEKDFADIRSYLETCKAPACTMPKKQFLLSHKFRVKSLVPIAYNKGKYGDRIRLDSGGDLCQPSLDGVELQKCSYMQQPKNEFEMPIISTKEYIIADDTDAVQMARLPRTYREGNFFVQDRGITFCNFDFTFKSKEVINKDWPRFRKAWNKQFGGDMGEFLTMMIGRYQNGTWTVAKDEDYPKYIREKVKNISKDKFGYDMWGKVKR